MVDLVALTPTPNPGPLPAALMAIPADGAATLPFAALLPMAPDIEAMPAPIIAASAAPQTALLALPTPTGKTLPLALPVLAAPMPQEIAEGRTAETTLDEQSRETDESTDIAMLGVAVPMPVISLPVAPSQPDAAAPASPMANAAPQSSRPAATTPQPHDAPPQQATARAPLTVNLVLPEDQRPLGKTRLAPVQTAQVTTPSTAPLALARSAADFAAPRDDRGGERAGKSAASTPSPALAPTSAPIAANSAFAPAVSEPVIAGAANPVAPARADIAQLVDRLVEARDAAQAGQSAPVVHAALRHVEFGAVNLTITAANDRIDVSLTSPDPDFARTVQAATPLSSAQTGTDTGSNPAPSNGHSGGTSAQASGQGQTGHQAQRPAQSQRGEDPRSAQPHQDTADRDAAPADPRRRGILA